MFDPKECDHVSRNGKSETEQIIEQLREENDLLKGCIMEICEVLFAEWEGGTAVSALVEMYVREITDENKTFTLDDVPAGLRQKVEAALDAGDPAE